MSKNIDEIVEEICPIPFIGSKNAQEQSINAGVHIANKAFKQALTEKKLVVPLSGKEIAVVLLVYLRDFDLVDRLAKAIYERQFKGDE